MNDIALSFRREYVWLTARLTARFGVAFRESAEDCAQQAFVAAIQTWPLHGEPTNPRAWLYRVAYQRMVDTWRGHRREVAVSDHLSSVPDWSAEGCSDEELRMIALACHPSLDEASQLCLMLQVGCGLNAGEIAAGMLQSESAIAQRLVRAKNRLRTIGARFDEPIDFCKTGRQILKTLYLLFNEGYVCSSGSEWVRGEICDEALDLTQRLMSTPVSKDPAIYALAALMAFHSSRLNARVRTAAGGGPRLVPLAEQDRSLWSTARIQQGFRWLEQSCFGDELTPYHAEAAIAACHAAAPSFSETNWHEVRQHYEDLLRVSPSPSARLNACVATTMLRGAEAGLAEFLKLDVPADNHHFDTVAAWIYERSGDLDSACCALERALRKTKNVAEQQFIREWKGRLLVSPKVPDAGNSQH